MFYCRRGWANTQVCIDLDAGGFFGTFNATGLLANGTVQTSDFASVDISPMTGMFPWKVMWGDSLYPQRGLDLPSFAIMYWSGWSMSLLTIVVMLSFFQYLTLLTSSAQTAGDEVMYAYYASGEWWWWWWWKEKRRDIPHANGQMNDARLTFPIIQSSPCSLI